MGQTSPVASPAPGAHSIATAATIPSGAGTHVQSLRGSDLPGSGESYRPRASMAVERYPSAYVSPAESPFQYPQSHRDRWENLQGSTATPTRHVSGRSSSCELLTQPTLKFSPSCRICRADSPPAPSITRPSPPEKKTPPEPDSSTPPRPWRNSYRRKGCNMVEAHFDGYHID